MASKQLYPCFACRKSGYEILVYLDGKDGQGRTKYLNEDGTKHTHKQAKQQHEQQTSKDFEVSEETVNKGITALFTQSKGIYEELVEIINRLQGLEDKVDHLTKLVYALTSSQQQK